MHHTLYHLISIKPHYSTPNLTSKPLQDRNCVLHILYINTRVVVLQRRSVVMGVADIHDDVIVMSWGWCIVGNI